MNINELALMEFLRGKLGKDSEVSFIRKNNKRKDLKIETQQELKQKVLADLIREFYQKDYEVKDGLFGFIVDEVSIIITGSDMHFHKSPPFCSFITFNE